MQSKSKLYFRGTSRPKIFPLGQSNNKDNSRVGERISYCIDSNYGKGTNTISKGRRQLVRAVLTPDRADKRQNGRRIKENGEPMFTLTGQDKHGLLVEKIKGKVEVRKYPVDIEKLKILLREHKLPYTIREIADYLNINKTTVEHWFRSDESFAIPDRNIWFKLKFLLNIDTDEFDKSIMEFEIRDNKFDQSNRVYHKEGIAPTITTLTGGHQHNAINDGYTIRRLTPVECERLQGFPDNWTLGSDTQRYKQCGNAVTVNVIEAIISKMLTK